MYDTSEKPVAEKLPHRKGWRIINVDGKQWYWRKLKESVIARSEDNKTVQISTEDIIDLVGRKMSDYDDGDDLNLSFYYLIAPHDVSVWLKKITKS